MAPNTTASSESTDGITCDGVRQDGQPCERRVAADNVEPVGPYCHDHEWQARFQYIPAYFTQILKDLGPVEVEVQEVETISTEWGDVYNVKTQFGTARLDTEFDIKAGETYIFEAVSPRDLHGKIRMYVTEVEG